MSSQSNRQEGDQFEKAARQYESEARYNRESAKTLTGTSRAKALEWAREDAAAAKAIRNRRR